MIPEYLLTGLAIGITIDFLVDDPPNRYHPVAWLGKLIEFFIPKLKDNNRCARKEKIHGIVFASSLAVMFFLTIHFALSAINFGIYYFLESHGFNQRHGKTYR
jgi:cobalamin biosynthesis protein CobD/CbiB